MKRPRRPRFRGRKRTLLVVLPLLIGGAIINVAVAWGCALWSERPQDSKLTYVDVAWLWTPSPTWPQATLRWISGTSSFHLTIVQGYRTKADGREIEISFRQQQVDFGFPMRSLSMFAEIQFPTASQQRLCSWQGRWAIPFHNKADSAWAVPIEGLPIIPNWPGFAINTIFYAAILWPLLAVPGFVRRRLRTKRGQCPACAYPVGVSDVCTECGAALPLHPGAGAGEGRVDGGARDG